MLWAALHRLAARRAARATNAAPPAAPQQTAAPRWFSLPGQRIELQDTGFAIELCTRPQQPIYRLFSPEGVVLSWGADLQGLKGVAEKLAEERTEFTCPGGLQR